MIPVGVCESCCNTLDVADQGVIGKDVIVRNYNPEHCEVCEQPNKQLLAVPLVRVIMRVVRHLKEELEQ